MYSDDKVVALLAPAPAAGGHMMVVPREHFPIVEQVPDFVVGEMFCKANKLSVGIFEALGAQGTNLLLQNGVAAGQRHGHVALHVIPRKEGDGLNLAWPPKQLSEEEMSTLELKIKDAAKNVGAFEQEKPKPAEAKKPEEVSEAEEYLVNQMRRIP